MSESNSSSLRIHLLGVKVKIVTTVSGLTGESFIDFKDINLFFSNSGFSKSFGDSEGWADSHDGGGDSSHSEGTILSDNRESEFFSS